LKFEEKKAKKHSIERKKIEDIFKEKKKSLSSLLFI
jgi:hypothetical protein